jgi:medium-chain acyl-[acyl-carrier-protein] hydrolase
MFRDWPQYFPDNVEVHPVELPGRQSRFNEAPVKRLSRLAPILAKDLERWLGPPFSLFGHSMGALVAFELARELRRKHQLLPARLIVSGYSAPHLPRVSCLLHALTDNLFLKQVALLLPPEVGSNQELMRLMLPTLRADFALCETYQYYPEPPLECAISAYAGNADLGVGFYGLSQWQLQTSRAFNCRLFPGDHSYLMASPQQLLKALKEDLKPFTQ